MSGSSGLHTSSLGTLIGLELGYKYSCKEQLLIVRPYGLFIIYTVTNPKTLF